MFKFKYTGFIKINQNENKLSMLCVDKHNKITIESANVSYDVIIKTKTLYTLNGIVNKSKFVLKANSKIKINVTNIFDDAKKNLIKIYLKKKNDSNKKIIDGVKIIGDKNLLTNKYINDKKINDNDSNDNILCKIKYIVCVFPQFHSIPENDKQWGKDFTEWNNVKNTEPVILFQKIIFPHETIGYYNLLEYETRKRYHEFAKNTGITTFMYYHYYFENKVVMEKPLLNQLIDDDDSMIPNIEWFVSFVNENWTKRWDGGNNEIFLKITYDDPKIHYDFLSKLFKSKNYLKTNNKPWFAIYILDAIPKKYLQALNNLAIKDGFNGLNIISTNNHIENTNFCENLSIDFHPNFINRINGINVEFNKSQIPLSHNNYIYDDNDNFIFDKYLKYNPDISHYFNNNLSDIYNHFINIDYLERFNRTLPVHLLNLRETYEKISNLSVENNAIPGIFTRWDNTPRHNSLKSRPSVFIDGNIKDFEKMLINQICKIKNNKNKYILINAFNEWGEGCVLEQSNLYNNQYAEIIKKYNNVDFSKISQDLNFKTKSKKRILFISHDNSLYGASNVLLNLVKKIDDENIYEIYLIIKNTTCEKIDNNKFNDLTIIYLNFEIMSLYSYYYYTDQAVKILKCIEPDIVFCNTLCTGEFYKASIDLSYYTIIYIHENISEFYRIVNNNHEWSMFPDYNQLNRANKILCVNKHIKNYLMEILICDVNNIFIQHPFINTDNIDILKETPSKILNKILNKISDNNINKKYLKIIGMCGSGTYRKGFDIFVDIAKKYDKYFFIWIGPNVDFKNLTIPVNMIVTGYTNNPYNIIINIDIFLCTSREDPYPLVILEAMYLNKKIISFPNVGNIDIILKNGGIIISNINEFNIVNTLETSNLNTSVFIKNIFSLNYSFKNIIEIFDNVNELNILGDYIIPEERFEFISLKKIYNKIYISTDKLKYSDNNYFNAFIHNYYNKNKNINYFKVIKQPKLNYNDYFYKLNYSDIKESFGNVDGYEHYKNNGLIENRLCYDLFKNNKKIAITLQIHNSLLLDEFNIYMNNIISIIEKFNYYYDIYVCCYNDIYDIINANFKKYNNVYIDTIENYGADISKFLLTLKTIINSGKYYDYIFKIHTKTDDFWRNKMMKIFEHDNLTKIFNLFLMDNKIGQICSCEYIRLLPNDGKFVDKVIDNDYTQLFNLYLKFKNNCEGNNIYAQCDTNQQIIDALKKSTFDYEYYVNAYNDLSHLKKNESEEHFLYNGCYEGRFCNKDICNELNFPKYCSGTIFVSRSNTLLSFFDKKMIDVILENMKNNDEFGYVSDVESLKHSHCIERMFGLVNYLNWQYVYGI